VNEPECQLVNHVALVQLDSVDTDPMDACNALTAPSEGVRRFSLSCMCVGRTTSPVGHPATPNFAERYQGPAVIAFRSGARLTRSWGWKPLLSSMFSVSGMPLT
jgi:hypothetical protein